MRKMPIAEGLRRPTAHEFFAGLHRPTGAPRGGLHAVSTGIVDGARRSVCGLTARFVPADSDWTMFSDYRADLCCEKCMALFGDESAVKAKGFGQ